MPENTSYRQPTLFDVQQSRLAVVGERPIERLEQNGTSALSIVELLAIVIGSGNGDDAAIQLAHFLLSQAGGLPEIAAMTQEELIAIQGIGRIRASKIKASLELGRRLLKPSSKNKLVVKSAADAANLLIPDLFLLEQEHLCLVLLNTRNVVVSVETLYVGTLNSATIRVCELFKAAVRKNAASIVVAHNHPSGDPSPSQEDIRVTRQIVEAGKLLGIEVADHLVIGGNRFVSLRERKLGF